MGTVLPSNFPTSNGNSINSPLGSFFSRDFDVQYGFHFIDKEGNSVFKDKLFDIAFPFDDDTGLAKVKELEIKVKESEAKSAEENVKIVEKVVTKTNVIREKGKDVVQYIDREVVKYDSKCEIPKEAVIAVNKAAEGVK